MVVEDFLECRALRLRETRRSFTMEKLPIGCCHPVQQEAVRAKISLRHSTTRGKRS